VHVSINAVPIRNEADQVLAATAVVRDISEARRVEEARRGSEEILRLMIENARDYAIFSTDPQRRITTWNSGAQRLLGYTEEEVIGAAADIIFTEEDRAQGAPDQECTTALATGRASDDRMHRRKDGSRFWASGVMMLMRDAQGRAVGFVKILRDQTAARQAQQALEHSRAQLAQAMAQTEKARSELEEADRAKDRFLALLSHELRNPLASIDSAAGLLLSPGAPPGDRDAAAQVVQRQAAAMQALMDDLLDVSRLKLGRFQLHRDRVMLSDVVGAALETTRPLLDAARHTLSIELPRYLVELDADPLRVSQVLSNLLSNAIKYTQPGGHIAVKARLEGKQAVISVIDNGLGIEPAQMDRMFEMFTQIQPAIDRGKTGLGIGLALVRNIVELHGGRIEASSGGPGLGSEFRVFLPAVRGVAPSAGAPAPAPPTALAPDPQEHRRGLVLVADDNVDAGWGIARLLEIAGFATLCVQGGLEAVEAARRESPDVAILDIGMPDLGGHEVARQIRETEWGRQMVLIAATGWGQEADARDALEAGFDAHMTKPVDVRKLGALVDDLLQRRRA
jgi:two-component system CheB/CheR fusion protein